MATSADYVTLCYFFLDSITTVSSHIANAQDFGASFRHMVEFESSVVSTVTAINASFKSLVSTESFSEVGRSLPVSSDFVRCVFVGHLYKE